MITIVHGDDNLASRDYLVKIKGNQPHITFDEKSFDPTTAKQVLEGGSLFGEGKTIIIENLSNLPSDLLLYLSKEKPSNELIFWDSDNLNSQILKKFSTARVLHFKLKPVIFSFLDGIKSGNSKFLVSTFHLTLKTTEPEVVFYMLTRRFRLMLALLDSSKGTIDELKNLLNWQKSKLKKQAEAFGVKKLLELYKKLYQIEVTQKTGNTGFSLRQSLDLFLLEI